MGEAWRRFRRDRLALGALGVILLLVAVAVGAPFLAPYDPSPQFFDRDFAQIGGARRIFQFRDQLGGEFVGMPLNHTYQP